VISHQFRTVAPHRGHLTARCRPQRECVHRASGACRELLRLCHSCRKPLAASGCLDGSSSRCRTFAIGRPICRRNRARAMAVTITVDTPSADTFRNACFAPAGTAKTSPALNICHPILNRKAHIGRGAQRQPGFFAKEGAGTRTALAGRGRYAPDRAAPPRQVGGKGHRRYSRELNLTVMKADDLATLQRGHRDAQASWLWRASDQPSGT
jgi:hypothetical protein